MNYLIKYELHSEKNGDPSYQESPSFMILNVLFLLIPKYKFLSPFSKPLSIG